MNIKKSKITLALSSLLFLSLPLSSVFADENHHEAKEVQQIDTMTSIKNELRSYVESVKSDDSAMMQQHINKLLQLTDKASKEVPAKINAMHDASKIDHSKMDMKDMSAMNHSKMDMKDMPEMDHSKMDMKDMSGMDHSKMNMESTGHDMSTMPSMEGMSSAQHHQHLIYMQGTEKLQASFKQLAKAQNKSEIKIILEDVKEHIQKYELFR